MSFEILSQKSLTGAPCFGYLNTFKSDDCIWRPADDAPASDPQMIKYLETVGYRYWYSSNPIAEIREARNSVEKVVNYRIADNPGGWNAQSFALPSGEVFCPVGVTPAAIAFDLRRQTKAPYGSRARWQSKVAWPALTHPVLLTCLAVSFAALTKDIVGYRGPLVFQFCGGPGSHVSLAGELVSSLFEAPDCRGAIFAVRCTSLLQRDSVERVYAGMATVIAEAGLHMAGLSTNQKISAATTILELIRSAGALVLIDRYPVAASLMDCPELLAAIDDQTTTLMITSDRGHGIFDSLPKGISSSTDYARCLSADLASYNGRAGREFIKKLVQARAADPTGLRAKLESWIDYFVQNARITPGVHLEVETGRKFGLLYASLRLAAEFGIIPSDQKAKSRYLGPSLKRVFNMWRSANASPDQLINILERIAADPRTMVVDDRGGCKKREFTADADAFLIIKRDARELNIKDEAMERLIPDWPARKGSDEAARYQRREQGRLHFQRTLAGGKRVRVLCFVLPQTPAFAEEGQP